MNEQGHTKLTEAAGKVRSRICLVNFLEFLARSWWMVLPLGVLAIVAAIYLSGRTAGYLTSFAVLGLWLAGAGLWMLIRKPTPGRALMSLDENGDWKDQFGSAFFFASKPALEAGEERHVGRALETLPAAMDRVKAAFPMPGFFKMRFVKVTFFLIAVLPFIPFPKPNLSAGDIELTDEMLAEAELQAKAIDREKDEVDKLEGLDREEQKELERIRETVEGASDELANSEGKTTRDVLEALEARARAAERLAKKLGASSDEWASEEMIREMSQHADTADLATSLKDKNAEHAAVESDVIAEMLERPDLKLETQERVSTALDQTMEKATDEDHKKPVGERVGNASRKMDAKQPRTASREFEELAKHFRLVKQREEAKEKLQKLADKLRDAGSSISGSKLQKMQQLAGSQSGQNAPKGTQPISSNPLQNQAGITPMSQSPGQQGTQGQPMPIPGPQSPQGQGQQPGKGGMAMPIPGTGQKGKPMSMAGGPQGQKPGQQGSGLFAPIPGQTPGAATPGAGLGGAAGGASAGANGGLEAGTGTAALGGQATEKLDGSKASKVAAQINDDGESTFRPVEGQNHREQSQLQRQQVVVDLIKVEEEALDGKGLPMSRREHVTRYLSALRRQFDKGAED